MLRYIFAAVLIGHGIAHASGFIAAWTKNTAGYSSTPWIFTGEVTLQSPVGRAFGLLWLVAMLGFVGAGLNLLLGQERWPMLAVSAAAISLIAIVPWWKTVPPGAWVGAGFDLFVILSLLLPAGDRIVDLVK